MRRTRAIAVGVVPKISGRGVVDDAIVRVVDDEGELVGTQAEVQGVEHTAHEWNAEVRLEMLVVVPAERGDPVAGTDPEALKGGGQPPGAIGEVSVAVAVERAVVAAGDDLAPRKDLLGAAEDRRQLRPMAARERVRRTRRSFTGSTLLGPVPPI